ncbi:MAG: hypothetical protein IPM48_00975 [Saprospiraceae bacterium]|nr:hypothetical protein [Saprospiraceae bacterium]
MINLNSFTFNCCNSIFYARIIFLTSCVILSPLVLDSQETAVKLLECRWSDSMQMALHKKETVVLKIKYGKEYRKWINHSDMALVLEGVQNGSLLVTNDRNKLIRIPINGIETIQLINAKAKKKSGLLIFGVILSILGSLLAILSLPSVLDSFNGNAGSFNDGGSRGCSLLMFGLLGVVGGIILSVGGTYRYSEFDKIKREIRFDDPQCRCEWNENP